MVLGMLMDPRPSLSYARSLARVAVAVTALSGCGGTGAPGGTDDAVEDAPGTSICAGAYARVVDRGALTDSALVEASGLVASRLSPGVLWSHNDSGDAARLFALRSDGRALARLQLSGVQAVDFEDLARGPCPDAADEPGPCLWIADTGNNRQDRNEVVVYAVPEPALALEREFVELQADVVWRFPIGYPEQPIDIEAMTMTADGQLVFFEKNNLDRARAYRHPGPLVADQLGTLQQLAEFASPGLAVDHGRAITAADIHPSGERLLLRVYTAIYEYRFAAGQGLADLNAIAPLLVAAGPLTEPQGESVSYDTAGSGVFSVSEDPMLQPGQQLHFYPCQTQQ
jgi:hypothetical protein